VQLSQWTYWPWLLMHYSDKLACLQASGGHFEHLF
jgi:hypothetical protein